MSYSTPGNLKYTKEHEWALIQGDVATIGITDFAQGSLGDIVFVELPECGSTLEINQPFGVVESIKSVSDLYAPLSGEVLERNEAVLSSPELINQNSYENWLVKLKLTDTNQVNALLSSEKYAEICH